MRPEVRLRELARDAIERGGMAMAPRRERGLWSFLTWAFFLSQLAVGNAFASGAAQAAGSTADLDGSGGSGDAGTTTSGYFDRPDFDVASSSELHPTAAPSSTTPVQSEAVANAEKTGSIEQLDLTSDAGLALQSEAMPSSEDLESMVLVAENDGGGNAPDMASGAEPAIDLPPIGEGPLVDGGVLPPVLETIDDLIDDLGSTLDGLLVPVIGTVEDLASVLGPTLDLALSPVGALADNIAGTLGDTLDPVLAPVAGLAEGVGELIEPVGGIAGELIGLADPVIDAVQPVLSPVLNAVGATEPLLDPIIEVAGPVIDLVEPGIGPLLEPLMPAVAPVLGILPLSADTGGIFNALAGDNGQIDAVGAPGVIAFTVDAEVGGYDLMEAGAYTELGITLHETPLDTNGGAGDLIGNVAEPIGDLLDDIDNGNTLPGLLGSLQHEVALRGLGEGLI